MSTSSTRTRNTTNTPGYIFLAEAGGVRGYRLKQNGLTVLHKHVPGTGVVTTNLTYRVGSRDEARGETGLAHMLEHMLFKPTRHDHARGTEAAAAVFERETGATFNANTARERTTYYFSCPVEHFEQVLQIEAERMHDVLFTEAEFTPERGNVLSEFDMYYGGPEFALEMAMAAAALPAHPYGHEVIGYREDIARYTVAQLERFYRTYYRPDNATLMVVGDLEERAVLTAVRRHFAPLQNPEHPVERRVGIYPPQEGIRRVSVERQSATNILALGVMHEGFQSPQWHTTLLALTVLADGPESILHRSLVDAGVASSVGFSLEPTPERSLATILVYLAGGHEHAKVEALIRRRIEAVTLDEVRPLVRKAAAHFLTDDAFMRTSSLRLVAELTEYVAAGDWTEFGRAEARLRSVTPKHVHSALSTLFDPRTMTVGTFVGTST